MTAAPGRVVSCDITFDVVEPALIVFQAAVADGDRRLVSERFDATLNGAPLSPPTELSAPHGGRLHRLDAPRGTVAVSYRAELIQPAAPPPAADPDGPLGLEQLTYLRPSRYCPSDHVVGLAVAEFGALPPGLPRAAAIAAWVNRRVSYVSGASDVHDSAEDTLLTGQGVCRDFAHLGVVLCRALEVPARFASVYAPGLTPMDFHAVFEAWADGRWWVYDATRLVPRTGLVRIATGRDAADTAFATVLRGIANLTWIDTTATVSGLLPTDDHLAPVVLP